MKILIHSIRFLPEVGGLENIMAGLAAEWTSTGHEVVVFTASIGSTNGFPYRVKRQYKLIELRHEIKHADVFIEANISLKTFWIGLLNKKKWFVIHHAQYRFTWNWKDFLKSLIVIFPHNIAVSQFVAKTLYGKGIVIHNFFDDRFRCLPEIVKTKQLVFVGRLVSDKGVNDLIDALYLLLKKGVAVSCSIIGDGPDRISLEENVKSREMSHQITFKGVLKGNELVEEINRHHFMVIPSRWLEPFGIVALEGLACGCRIICSSGGGLKEATGGLAYYFQNGNSVALAKVVEDCLTDLKVIGIEGKTKEHLRLHTATVVAQEYIKYFQRVLI